MPYQQSNTVTILLAGGKSRRFDAIDKASLMLGGVKLVDRAAKLAEGFSYDCIIAGHSDYETGLPLWPDMDSGPAGPSAALWSFQNQTKYDYALTLPLDCPNLPKNLLERLASNTESRIAATPSRQHSAIGWWRRHDLVAAFKTSWHLGERSPSLHKLAEQASARRIIFEDEDQFININTPQDAETAKRIMKIT